MKVLNTPTDSDPSAVRAEALTKTYGSGNAGVRPLQDLSISFPAGSFTAVMGPSGSGKSTLMHVLGRLDVPDSGQITLATRAGPGSLGGLSEDSAGMTVLRTAEAASIEDLTRLGNAAETLAGELYLEAAMERASHGQVVDTVLVVVLVRLAASVLVAVVGVSNTLALSVFERRREAALLRAIGMTRGSVGAMVTLEALLIAAVALVLGSGLGAFFAWGGVSSLVAHDGVTMVLSGPWNRMGMIWGVTILAAVLASFLPARALYRTPPAAAQAAQEGPPQVGWLSLGSGSAWIVTAVSSRGVNWLP